MVIKFARDIPSRFLVSWSFDHPIVVIKTHKISSNEAKKTFRKILNVTNKKINFLRVCTFQLFRSKTFDWHFDFPNDKIPKIWA